MTLEELEELERRLRRRRQWRVGLACLVGGLIFGQIVVWVLLHP